MEPSYVEDTHYTTAMREKVKPRLDETKVSRREVDTERITIMKSDTTCTEEPERQIYPKEHDIGRIVIEEIPEDEQRKYLKYQSEPKSTKVTVTKEHVTDATRAQEKENAMNVEKLDFNKVDTRQVEARRIAERPLKETERVERPRKACVKYFHGSIERSHRIYND